MIYYIITRSQDKTRYFFKGSARVDGVRVAIWSPERIKARKFIKYEEAQNCISRDKLKHTTIEGPGARAMGII